MFPALWVVAPAITVPLEATLTKPGIPRKPEAIPIAFTLGAPLTEKLALSLFPGNRK